LKSPVEINPKIEEIVEEIDLPKDLKKLRPIQETQIKNIFKRLDKIEIDRRWKLINIGLNLANRRHKERDISNFTILSNLVYESKMIRKSREESMCSNGFFKDHYLDKINNYNHRICPCCGSTEIQSRDNVWYCLAVTDCPLASKAYPFTLGTNLVYIGKFKHEINNKTLPKLRSWADRTYLKLKEVNTND
jgi:hypothetical protein